MTFSFAEREAAIDAAPVDAGAPDPGPDTAADTPVGAPVDAGDTADTPVAAPDPFDGIDLDALRALAEVAPNLLNARPEPTQVQQPAPDGPPELDMFDPESVRAYMQWEREQTLGQIKGMIDPLASRAEQQAQAEQQALLKDAAHDVETKKGEFIGDDAARAYAREQMLEIARSSYPQFAARYGHTDRAAELALEHGHERVKSFQDTIAKMAVDQHVNRNAKLAGQHTEPGVGSGSGIETTEGRVLSPRELALKYGNRAAALNQQ